jgi:hypothetical protein
MERTSNGRIVRRCVACLVVLSIAAGSLLVLANSSKNARAQSLAQEQYQSQVQYDYGRLPVGHVQDFFTRAR